MPDAPADAVTVQTPDSSATVSVPQQQIPATSRSVIWTIVLIVGTIGALSLYFQYKLAEDKIEAPVVQSSLSNVTAACVAALVGMLASLKQLQPPAKP